MTKKHFTLMELLIVITIIAILFSMLMPSFSKATKRSKMAVCLSNLHEQGKAYTLFAFENNKKFMELHRDGSPYVLQTKEAKKIAALSNLPFINRDPKAKKRYNNAWQCPLAANSRHGVAVDYKADMYNIDSYSILTNMKSATGSYSSSGTSPSRLTDPTGPLAADTVVKFNSRGKWKTSHSKEIRSGEKFNQIDTDLSARTRIIGPISPTAMHRAGAGYYYWEE